MRALRSRFLPILALLAVAQGAVVWGCSSSGDDSGSSGSGASATSGGTNGGGTDNGGGSSTGGTTGDVGGAANTGGSFVYGDGGVGICGDSNCACSNGLDDDGDGQIDGFDSECTGPLDNDEGSFATGIPGDNRDPKWQDCFFDGNSGAGDDGCRYHTDCLYGLKEPSDPDCTLSSACIEFCGARTPSGCDCFGCCTVQREDGSTIDVLTGSSCSLEQLDDPDACKPCVKSSTCTNDCGECELCPGKTVDDLPESCRPPEVDSGTPPPGYTCDEGRQVCGPEQPPCPSGYYCQLGCCTIVVF